VTFACIQMDPPWGERGGGGRGAQDHYDGRPGWSAWGNQAPGQEAGAA
jgi:hypothetical protein